MPGSAIDLSHVQVSFGGRSVLTDVSARVPLEEITVFAGPNGAGKTTLLLCLMGEVPFGGDIAFAPGLKGRLGYVPQSLQRTADTPVTCDEFLALNASGLPLWLGLTRKNRARADRVLSRVGLERAGTRPVDELSGGEKRRLLLASALQRSPRLLLLDEPAAGVDMRGERLFWDLLDDLVRTERMTVVMVSHNLSLTAHYAGHVICLSRGRCLEGSPREVLTAENLMAVFGIPIHLYPEQCTGNHPLCPQCGAFRSADGCVCPGSARAGRE